MEKEDTVSVQWAQEDVETSYSLVNNIYIYIYMNKRYYFFLHSPSFVKNICGSGRRIKSQGVGDCKPIGKKCVGSTIQSDLLCCVQYRQPLCRLKCLKAWVSSEAALNTHITSSSKHAHN